MKPQLRLVADRPAAWSVSEGGPTIPAPSGGWQRLIHGLPVCDAMHPGQRAAVYALRCDRLPGHTGRHAAYGPSMVLAVWP